MLIDHLYDKERNIHWYHVGGYYTSDVYKKFYQWCNGRKLHYSYSDMPHDYFVFLHEADRLEMHERFGCISPMEDREIWLDEFFDHTLQVGDPLMDALEQAIQEEIDKEIFESIRRSF